MITVELPNVLCSYTDQNPSMILDEPCETVGDALAALGRKSPGALDRIMDERGDVRRHVNLFVNGENVRFLAGLETAVPNGATIFVLAAVSGG
ncbi:MAG: sulfur-carrier protein [Gemmatimonadaceae bacterium]|nr:sulfur-carrier protein [Gemmatimonadaceae bacterium]MEA2765350.1 sulfur-carrier protein [Gemmatimonadaceae bacterium]